MWSRRRTPGARWVLWTGFVVFPLLVLLQALVVTDRERLVSICHSLAHAYRDGDLVAFGRQVSGSFGAEPPRGAEPWDKTALLEWLEGQLASYRIEEPRLSRFEVEVEGDRAVVRFSATCRVITPDQIITWHPSAWELGFRRTDRGWLMENLRPRATSIFPYSRLGDLPR